jgi:predicted metal-dependent hydrolase
MMLRVTNYGTAPIEYGLERSSRLTLSISVLPDCTVRVVAPLEAALEEIDERVRRRARWILRQQRRYAAFRPRTPARQYIGGETHRYLGRQYRLKIVRAPRNRVVLRAGRLTVETSNPDDREVIKKLVRAWVRARANVILRQRFEATVSFRAALGARRPTLRILAMKRRWGSFTGSGNILLNELLVTAPRQCIDYVIVHELCHAAVPNHSPRFFQLLRRFMPDWEARKELLERSTV